MNKSQVSERAAHTCETACNDGDALHKLRAKRTPAPPPPQMKPQNTKTKKHHNKAKRSTTRPARQVRNPCQKLGMPTHIKLESEPQVPGQCDSCKIVVEPMNKVKGHGTR
eukprot:3125182-Amphidinium_carterae.3